MLPGHQRTNIITLGKLSQPSYLTEIQIRLGYDTSDSGCPRRKGATQIDEMTLQDSRETNYGSEFRNKSSSLNQGEEEEVADGLGAKSSNFQTDGFPQLCEHGDNICQIKWYNGVCSSKTYIIKHWLKSTPDIWISVA